MNANVEWMLKGNELGSLRKLLACPAPLVRWRLQIEAITVICDGEFAMLLPVDKYTSASVQYQDSKGNPAKVEGVPKWSTDREDLVQLHVEADGMSCGITPLGPLGSTQISVLADADLGEGVKEITAIGTLEVVAGGAVTATVNFGEVTDTGVEHH